MSSPSKIAALMTAADAAYDAENVDWFEALPTEDLTALWGVACANVSGASWDDEVYEALAKRGWFEAEVSTPGDEPVWVLWHGGPGYSLGGIEDSLEKFPHLQAAKDAMSERFNAHRYPATFHPVDKDTYDVYCPSVSESSMTVWRYDPRGVHDPYPDLLLQQTDNDEIEEQTT